VREFSKLKVVVIGDLIVDEYITCDPVGMSQEDPTIVVTPIQTDLFVGGAGIVAAHACGLGAAVEYFGIVGDDQAAVFARDRLESYGVKGRLIVDDSRPTTLKQRFRARGKTLLRVSHLRQHDISQELISDLLDRLLPVLEDADLLVFSDFNYGCLPQPLVDELIGHCVRLGVMAVADSQSSSQIGDISRFQGMQLITPTEHEARLSVRDPGSGLTVLAEALHNKAQAGNVFITMGSEGLLIHVPRHAGSGLITTDQLPAFNTAPKDVSGAGDSLLTCASMALVVGANIWESAYLGSVAAACQVGRVGNTPLSAAEVLLELSL
jgi:rfaE bifunctional protein kinase chain/domain